MKKLKLHLNGKQMLTKEAMKKIGGGAEYLCYEVGGFSTEYFTGESCCMAQAICETVVYLNYYPGQFENGCDCRCDEGCA